MVGGWNYQQVFPGGTALFYVDFWFQFLLSYRFLSHSCHGVRVTGDLVSS